jgi:hypothetical protein
MLIEKCGMLPARSRQFLSCPPYWPRIGLGNSGPVDKSKRLAAAAWGGEFQAGGPRARIFPVTAIRRYDVCISKR